MLLFIRMRATSQALLLSCFFLDIQLRLSYIQLNQKRVLIKKVKNDEVKNGRDFFVDEMKGNGERERIILAEYSDKEVRKHLEYLTTLNRIAGTEDERKAAQYIKSKLDEYGVDSEIYEFDAYISYPGKSSLEILSPVQKTIPSFPRIHIAPTPPEGIVAELISLSKKTADEVQRMDVAGKIVLIEGDRLSRRYVAPIAHKMGAVAQIHITRAKNRAINMGGVRNVWGSPTPETLKDVSRIHAVAICNEDGKYLDELTKQGQVRVRLNADAWRGYKEIRVPVGHIQGAEEPDKFVLFAAHYCCWFIGAMDNASANSLLLEMARVFSKHRGLLNRGIRFAWWSGHEQGPYAGSTWYADNFWDDLRDNAIAYYAMDGIAGIGSSVFESRNTEEVRKFQEKVIKDALGLEVKSVRVPKSGDMSFDGLGLPSAMARTSFPEDQTDSDGLDPAWYNHTAEDRLDKVDVDLIETTFKAHATSAFRLCSNPVLPFDFLAVEKVFRNALEDLQRKNKSDLDLTPLMSHVETLRMNLKALYQGIENHLTAYGRERKDSKREGIFMGINACLMRLGRILMPVLTSKTEKYIQDEIGTRFKPIPSLQPLVELSGLDKHTDDYQALRTSLVRARNKLADELKSANDLLNHTLENI
jgi:hypothetical protein